MHWELRISPSVRRSEIFPIEKHPPPGVGGNGVRSGAGFTRGRESFAKTFPLINLVYRWAGSGDACALRSRQNLKYGQLSKFTRDAPRGYVPRSRPPPRPTSIIGKERVGSRNTGDDFRTRRAVTESRIGMLTAMAFSRGNNCRC